MLAALCCQLGTVARAQAAPTTDADEVADEAVPAVASELLGRGFAALSEGHSQQAVQLLQGALATGELNEPGRTLCYWYLFIAQQRLGAEHPSAEALLGFVSVAEELLAEQQAEPHPAAEQFVDRFDLRRRLARARATLSAVWAARVGAFGRQKNQPVPVQSTLEQDYFLRLMVPCAGSLNVADSQQWPRARLERITVQCDEARQDDHQQFYFERPLTAPQ